MRVFLTVLATLLVAACGNKGPLYLPENPPEVLAPSALDKAPTDEADRKRNEASS